MLTITLQPVGAVVKRSIQSARSWFQDIGSGLAERLDDPIALFVPSVIVPEYNVVLYPRPQGFEPEFVRLTSVEPFEFDPRMFDEIPSRL
jgi:hypothetical protein